MLKTITASKTQLAIVTRRLERLAARAPEGSVTWTISPLQWLGGYEAHTITVNVVTATERGFRLLGEVEHLPANEDGSVNANLIPFDPDLESDVLRWATPTCEHCGYTRNRKSTVILRNPSGKLMQVGTSCIKHVTGASISSLTNLVSAAGTIRGLSNAFDEKDRGIAVMDAIVNELAGHPELTAAGFVRFIADNGTVDEKVLVAADYANPGDLTKIRAAVYRFVRTMQRPAAGLMGVMRRGTEFSNLIVRVTSSKAVQTRFGRRFITVMRMNDGRDIQAWGGNQHQAGIELCISGSVTKVDSYRGRPQVTVNITSCRGRRAADPVARRTFNADAVTARAERAVEDRQIAAAVTPIANYVAAAVRVAAAGVTPNRPAPTPAPTQAPTPAPAAKRAPTAGPRFKALEMFEAGEFERRAAE